MCTVPSFTDHFPQELWVAFETLRYDFRVTVGLFSLGIILVWFYQRSHRLLDLSFDLLNYAARTATHLE